MFAVELKFEELGRGTVDAKTNAISSLIGAFIHNGNLLGEPSLAKISGGWTVFGLAPARDAFQKANWNEFVKRWITGLQQVNLKRPQIRFLGLVPEAALACRCARPGAYFLFTTFLHLEPPLRCIRCGGTIPLYRLPRATKGDSGLLSWTSNYRACDTLWINSRVGERFGLRQMSDPTSELSRSGLAVCVEIKRLTGRPVYYYLHRADARGHSAEMERRCPKCGGAWRLKKPLHRIFDFKCDKCHLLSNIAWNIRP
jgi:predicted  nucleic acid-binding Zn ribbon protein